MGEDKSALRLGSRTLLQYMGEIFSAVGLNKIYISRPDAIADYIPGQGPLGGIHAVLYQALLSHVKGELHTHLVLVAVDMPCLTPDVIDRLIHAPAEKDLVRYDAYPIPFRLAVKPHCFELADHLLCEGNNVSLRHFQSQIKKKHILDTRGLDLQVFRNLNTPEEWQDFLEKETP